MNGLNNLTNAQYISNTTTQPSVLNGGNLSRSFNTQVMKVLKGIVHLSSNDLGNKPAILYPVINESTGNPIMLGQGDFVVGYGICNRSTNGQNLTLPLTPANNNLDQRVVEGNTPVLEIKLTPRQPFYNVMTKTWSFDIDENHGLDVITYPLTPLFGNGPITTGNNSGATGCTGSINLGFGTLTTAYSYIIGPGGNVPLIYYTSCGPNNWLQLRQNYNPFTIVPPAVNAGTISITLIVMTVINGTTESINSVPATLQQSIPLTLQSLNRSSLQPTPPNVNLYEVGPHKSIYYKNGLN